MKICFVGDEGRGCNRVHVAANACEACTHPPLAWRSSAAGGPPASSPLLAMARVGNKEKQFAFFWLFSCGFAERGYNKGY
jgi:hypothetical protein